MQQRKPNKPRRNKMLTIAQIAYRDAQKFNSVPRSERTLHRLDGATGVPLPVWDEIKENIGECTRDNEREYLNTYNQLCDK